MRICLGRASECKLLLLATVTVPCIELKTLDRFQGMAIILVCVD